MIELTQAGWEVIGISLALTVVSSIIRKFTIDKEKMDAAKEKMNHHKGMMEKAKKANDIKGVQKHQAHMMEATMDNLKAGMKPMLYTFIPIILIFSHMGSSYGDMGKVYNVSIIDFMPQRGGINSVYATDNGTVSQDGKSVMWKIQQIDAEMKGSYNVSFSFDYKLVTDVHDFSVEYVDGDGISKKYDFKQGVDNPESVVKVRQSSISGLGNKAFYTIDYENSNSWKVSEIFGYPLGWLGTYLLTSIFSSMILNKILGIR